MRNFKKFLALVLAMLMVSACAVSVSAFADDDAVNASGYAAAITELNALDILVGNENGEYVPAGTLTRDAAAKIAAKLLAGTKNIDWSASTTCVFADVEQAWSFGFITYAYERGAMQGVGNGKFNPKGTLSIAEAAAMCVNMLGLKADVMAMDGTKTPTPWYVNYMYVAEALGLLDGVDFITYSEPCTRGMMAQIASNALHADITPNPIKNAFGIKSATFEIVKVADGQVTVDPAAEGSEKTFNAEALAAKLGADPATLVGSKIKVSYSPAQLKNRIYGADILSAVTNFTYADACIATVKDKDNKVIANQIKIGDYTYDLKGMGDSTSTPGIGGASTTSVYGIAVTVDGAKITDSADIPAYYSAVAYDDNNDGLVDRVDLTSYTLGTVTKTGTAKDKDNKDVDVITVTPVNTKDDGPAKVVNSATPAVAVSFTGVAITLGETPVLYRVSGTTVDVLKVADVVAGTATAMSTADKYITVGNKNYTLVPGATLPGAEVLKQTVSIFVMDGKYVATSASFKAVKNIFIDKVVVSNDKAVVTGLDADNKLATVSFVVEGVKAANDADAKFSSMSAHVLTYKVDDKEYNGYVAVGTKGSDGKWTDKVTFVEGQLYTFEQTADGVYFVSSNGAVIDEYVGPAGSETNATFEVTAKYVNINGISQYFNDGAIILTINKAKAADILKDAYADTYTLASSFAKKSGVSFKLVANADKKVSMIQIVTAGVGAGTTLTKIANDKTIVQIIGSAYEFGYDYYMYEGVDLKTGAVVKVRVNGDDILAAGDYVDTTAVADGFATYVEADQWVVAGKTVTVTTEGVITKITAKATQLYKADGADKFTVQEASKATEFGVNITVYVADAKGVITVKDGKAVEGKSTDITTDDYTAYVVADQMIIIK